VRLFREGMRELMKRVETDDHAGVGEILSELDEAAEAWTRKLGTKPNMRKLSLQVAIPFLSPSLDVPVPTLTRSPAKKLLVLVERLIR
jgi:hypothetical protein